MMGDERTREKTTPIVRKHGPKTGAKTMLDKPRKATRCRALHVPRGESNRSISRPGGARLSVESTMMNMDHWKDQTTLKIKSFYETETGWNSDLHA